MAKAPEFITIKLVLDVEETNARLNDTFRKVAAGMRAAWNVEFQPRSGGVILPLPNPLADAFDAGFTACAAEHTKQSDDPGHPIARVNPYRQG